MNSSVTEAPDKSTTNRDRQVVALHLGDEVYGVDIAAIHSVLTPQEITFVPNVPTFVLGVMNLRGRILPVLDLRSRFGMEALAAEKRKFSRTVIIEAGGFTAGLVVDSVSEVLTFALDTIESPSILLCSADMSILTGIGRVTKKRRSEDDKEDDRTLIILIDVTELLKGIASLTSQGDVQ